MAARFVPGTRLPTYVAAGLARLPLLEVAATLALGALLWTPILVGLAMLLGKAALAWLGLYERAWLVVLVAAAAALLLERAARPFFSWKGRRLLLGRWHRLTRWEFWPAWLVNLPVVAFVLGLAARHRSLTLFTAANPAIPDGGFVLESKGEILRGLAGGPRQGDHPDDPDANDDHDPALARTTVLPAGEPPAVRLERLRAFRARHGLDFPVVVKPDVGQRGAGVAIVRDESQFLAVVAGPDGAHDLLLQEYVAGEEFGVFWIHPPGEPEGFLFSITEKRLLHLEGDGERTLEELILADGRAVSMAPTHCARHRAALDTVPGRGERIALVEIGNHCRGALFLDGRSHATEALRQAVGAIAARFTGFHFGRFDLRAPSVEALREGRDLKVLELNGVASEATHIYHPGASLLAAYATLFRQWRWAFHLGAENRRRGHRPATLRELARRLAAWRRGEKTLR